MDQAVIKSWGSKSAPSNQACKLSCFANHSPYHGILDIGVLVDPFTDLITMQTMVMKNHPLTINNQITTPIHINKNIYRLGVEGILSGRLHLDNNIYIGVSMFDPTREHDTNPTRIFPGQGWALIGLGHKRVDPKATR